MKPTSSRVLFRFIFYLLFLFLFLLLILFIPFKSGTSQSNLFQRIRSSLPNFLKEPAQTRSVNNQLERADSATLSREVPPEWETFSNVRLIESENLASRPQEANLFGLVLYAENGQPAERAEVWACQLSTRGTNLAYRTRSNAAGEFAFQLPEGQQYFLYARLGSLVSPQLRSLHQATRSPLSRKLEPGKRVGPIKLELAATAELTVRVVSEHDKRPIPQARILYGANRAETPVTDAAGIATLWLEPGVWELFALKAGYQLAESKVMLREGQNQPLEIQLQPGGSIWGKLRTADERIPEQVVINAKLDFRFDTTVYNNGDYLCIGLPLDTDIHLVAFSERDGYSSAILKLDAKQPHKRHDFILSKREEEDPSASNLLKLRLVDLNGVSLPDIRIEIQKDELKQVASSGKEGRVTFEGLEFGFYRLRCLDPRFVIADLNSILRTQPPPNAKEILIRLKTNQWIAGHVYLPDGKPAVGALVMAFDRISASLLQTGLLENVRSDDTGFFQLNGLASEQDRVMAILDGYSSGALERIRIGKKDHEIRLGPLGRIRGQVVGRENQQPISAFKVFLNPEESQLHFRLGAPINQLLVLDPEGLVLFEKMDRTLEWNLEIVAEGYKPFKVTQLKAELAPNDTVHQWALEKGQARIAGRLSRKNGQPVAGAKLFLIVQAQREQGWGSMDWLEMQLESLNSTKIFSTSSDSAGRFAFQEFVDGQSWWLACRGGGIAKKTFPDLNLLPEAEWDSLVLFGEDPASVQFDFRCDREKYDQANVYYTRSDQTINIGKRVDFEKGQRTQLSELAPGRYRFSGRARPSGDYSSEIVFEEQVVELQEGQQLQLIMEPKERIQLKGRAFVGGKPLAGGTIGLVGATHSSKVTDSSGNFQFDGLTAGKYSLIALGFPVENWFHLQKKGQIELELTQDLTREFRFPVGGELKGVIEPSGRYEFELENPDNIVHFSSEAHFQLRHLPAGRYDFSLRRGGENRMLAANIEIREGTTLDLGTLALGKNALTLEFSARGWIENPRANLELFKSEAPVGDIRFTPSEPLQIDNLDPGAHRISLMPQGAFVFEPTEFRFEAGKELRRHLEVQPITFLQVASFGKDFASLSLQALPDGPKKAFIYTPTETFLRRDRQVFLAFAGNLAVARSLAPGRYELEMQFEGGESAKQLVELVAGKIVKVDLE